MSLVSRSDAGLEALELTASARGRPVVRAASLAVRPGTALWLSGPSGAGKSTLLRALARLWPETTGTLRLDGVPDHRVAPHAWRAAVLLLPTPPLPLGATVAEDLRAPFRLAARRGAPLPDDRSLRRELDALGLEEVELDRPPRELSQGQLARVALARALLARPRVLLLDEPAAHLDPGARDLVARRLGAFTREGGGAVIAGHAAPWAGIDRVLELRAGALGEPEP